MIVKTVSLGDAPILRNWKLHNVDKYDVIATLLLWREDCFSVQGINLPKIALKVKQ